MALRFDHPGEGLIDGWGERQIMRKSLLFVALALACGQLAAAEQSLTYEDLVKRLTDLEGLAILPQPGERCAQWSSYDRHSRYDEATGKYVAWDANGDGDGYIRKEGDQFVFAEMKGPGCLWRLWSAAPKQGHVRIYLDGAAEPAVDLPFIGYFDRQNEPFTRPALVHTVAMGWNNYTPIPYQKSCKIVADKDWGAYFQFVYATFPSGTKVPTFKRQLSAAEAAALDEANRVLSNCGTEPAKREGDRSATITVNLPPGKTNQCLEANGAGAICSIRARVDLPDSPEDRNALRELALRIYWDGERQPSVWAPLGDFFGTAAGANKYRSLPSGLTEDGWWYCNWYMPYAKKAVVELVNDGQQRRLVSLQIQTAPLTQPVAKLGRFHAKWHRDAFLPAEPERKIDWTLLKTEGKGRFCGVMLHVWNPRGGWWGEGDEKFFVDGEKFPSTFGTGSEDYFGYAWCNPTLFQNCYHNQTISMGNKGHVSVNRWHITDNIPFQKGFEGTIEKYFSNARPTLYASTVFWYLAPGGADAYRPAAITEREGYWTDVPTVTVKGAIEGERMKVLAHTGGNPQEQAMDGFTGDWSNSSQLWWTDAKPGDRLDLALPVAKSGNYQISAQLTKARDYGVVQVYVDGSKLGSPIDLYNSEVVPTGPLKLGTQTLTAGDHKLTFEITGANAAEVKAYMVGFDYVKLDPASE
jgi:hypothetical protein